MGSNQAARLFFFLFSFSLTQRVVHLIHIFVLALVLTLWIQGSRNLATVSDWQGLITKSNIVTKLAMMIALLRWQSVLANNIHDCRSAGTAAVGSIQLHACLIYFSKTFFFFFWYWYQLKGTVWN